jgi:protein-tyrosine phosphatase
MTRVLFVCLGNICRSPTAEGVFRHVAGEAGLLDRIETDSAGIGDWHVGQPPDARAQAASKARGVDISGQRARQVTPADFARFDYILAMDEDNLAALEEMRPQASTARVSLFLDYAPEAGARAVPDPFFGGMEGFEHACDLIEAASRGLLGHIRDEAGGR